jgi:hypothetical protein
MRIAEKGLRICPKCDAPLRARPTGEMLVVDVAHDGETWEEARAKIERAVARARRRGAGALKVIHGRGKEGSGIIRSRTIPLLQRLAARHGARLSQDGKNAGAHVLKFD